MGDSRESGQLRSTAEDRSSPPRQAILVLGMHRSGTSALGGVLNALGAGAPKTLMAAHPENPRGFFESAALANAHDALLASAGSSWDDWRQFNPQWIGSDIADQHRQQIARLLIDEFGDVPLIFVKDPRICRFVPFTLSVLSELNIGSVAILPVRNPLEVAYSLKRNRDFTIEKSLLLWLRHVLDAEYHSRHLPRYFLSYEQFLVGWRDQMNRAAETIGVTWPADSRTSDLDIEQFLTIDLWRERASVDEIADHPEIMPLVRETYRVLSEIVQSGETRGLLNRLDRLRTAFDLSCQMLAPVVAAEQSAAAQTRTELNSRAAELEQSRREKVNLAAELKQRSIEVNRLTTEQHSLSEVHGALTTERDNLVIERDELVVKLNRMRADQHSFSDALMALARERDNLILEVNRLSAEQRSSAEAKTSLIADRENLALAKSRLIATQEALLKSRSWRLTAPLRSLRKLLSFRDAGF